MEPYVSTLRRVGIAMLVYVGVRTAGLIADFATGASHSVTIDLLSLILGILLVRGGLGAARWVAFLSAMELTMTVLGFGLGLPLLLLFARAQLAAAIPLDGQTLWAILAVVFDVLFALWVLRELRDPSVEEALAAARRGSIRRARRWGAGFGLGAVLLALGIAVPIFSLVPRWTAPAVAAAHRELGDDWQVQVTRFTSGSKGWSAHVIARRGDEVRELDVHGDP